MGRYNPQPRGGVVRNSQANAGEDDVTHGGLAGEYCLIGIIIEAGEGARDQDSEKKTASKNEPGA